MSSAAGRSCSRPSARSDLEGIVAKWKHGRYHSDGCTTSWLKVRNPQYSQMAGRPELFGARNGPWSQVTRRKLKEKLQ